MSMSKEICEMLNHYVQNLFSGNAKIDNLVYNLQYKGFNNLASAIHVPVAHKMGELADLITDMMDENDARPVRFALPDEIQEYESATACFEELKTYFDNLLNITYKTISEADLNDAYEVKIFMEDFLNRYVVPLKKQSTEWVNAVKALGEHDFNIHVKEYTHYISL